VLFFTKVKAYRVVLVIEIINIDQRVLVNYIGILYRFAFSYPIMISTTMHPEIIKVHKEIAGTINSNAFY